MLCWGRNIVPGIPCAGTETVKFFCFRQQFLRSVKKALSRAVPPGCIDDWLEARRFANPREKGRLLDYGLDHSTPFHQLGPTRGQLAQVIRDQVFQVALLYATTAIEAKIITSSNVDDLARLLRHLGTEVARLYGAVNTRWEAKMSISLATVAEELFSGLVHQQGLFQQDLGFDNGPLSVQSLVLFSESLALNVAANAQLGASHHDKSVLAIGV